VTRLTGVVGARLFTVVGITPTVLDGGDRAPR
jgi:hypothetical protein